MIIATGIYFEVEMRLRLKVYMCVNVYTCVSLVAQTGDVCFQGSLISAGNEDMCLGAVQSECVSCSQHVDHCVSVSTPDDGWYRRGSSV